MECDAVRQNCNIGGPLPGPESTLPISAQRELSALQRERAIFGNPASFKDFGNGRGSGLESDGYRAVFSIQIS